MAMTGGPPRTQIDYELEGVISGPDLSRATEAQRRARAPMAGQPTYPGSPISQVDPATDLANPDLILTWGDFQQRHPEWRGNYWAECRALYAGGDRLLGDKVVLERLFPKHLHEDPTVYNTRKERAHYFPYPGTIIDHLLAGLGTDPLTISFDVVDDKGKSSTPSGADWWKRWVADVSDEAERPSDYGLESDDDEDDDEGGCSLHHFLVDVMREALQTQTAWVLGDLPSFDADDTRAITSVLDAERSGLMDPYLCIVPAEQVIDWLADERGRIQWALIMTCKQVRNHPRQRRGAVLHTYMLWTDETWTRYEIMVDPRQPPNENTPFPPVDAGRHGFGRVPLERLQLPEGIYAMGKLHSLAREHFNKRCAMSWAEYKSLFAVLYEFLAPEDKGGGLPIAESQTDPGRALNQVRGQGYTQVRGFEDKAMYVGPPTDPFVAARDSCSDTMREMHRVMFSMAMSANMDSGALRRSQGSKQSDSATTEVLLDAFGTILLRFARRLVVLAALGRNEAAPAATIGGYEKFDVSGVDSKIAEAVQLFAGVPMLSPLVKELYLAQLYSDLVGGMTQEQQETVREQIRGGLAAEEMAALALAGMGAGGTADHAADEPDGAAGDDGGDGGEVDDEPAPPPARARAKPAPGPPGASRPITRRRMAK